MIEERKMFPKDFLLFMPLCDTRKKNFADSVWKKCRLVMKALKSDEPKVVLPKMTL